MKRLALRGWGKSRGQGSDEKGRFKGKAQKKVCSRLNVTEVELQKIGRNSFASVHDANWPHTANCSI